MTMKPKTKYKRILIDRGDPMQWPRRCASEILKLENRDAMKRALDDVPENYREWVRFYLNDWADKCGGLDNLVKSIQSPVEKNI